MNAERFHRTGVWLHMLCLLSYFENLFSAYNLRRLIIFSRIRRPHRACSGTFLCKRQYLMFITCDHKRDAKTLQNCSLLSVYRREVLGLQPGILKCSGDAFEYYLWGTLRPTFPVASKNQGFGHVNTAPKTTPAGQEKTTQTERGHDSRRYGCISQRSALRSKKTDHQQTNGPSARSPH